MRFAAGSLLLFVACASGGAKPDAADEADDADEGIMEPKDARFAAADAAADLGANTSPHDATPNEAPSPAADAAADLSADAAPVGDSARPVDAGAGVLQLASTGFLTRNGELIFPASASYPMDQSPPFEWSGAPAATKSFALTFVDEDNGATKWVLWDIPAAITRLPGNLSKTAHPTEVPEASQRGSLGRTGYSGPGVAGPPLHVYQFVVWALDVQKLQNTDGLSTADLRTKLLPTHALARSAPLVAKGQLGGP
jgi:Raf kinase inhibitor-like YbhB/YbcL family protein